MPLSRGQRAFFHILIPGEIFYYWTIFDRPRRIAPPFEDLEVSEGAAYQRKKFEIISSWNLIVDLSGVMWYNVHITLVVIWNSQLSVFRYFTDKVIVHPLCCCY